MYLVAAGKDPTLILACTQHLRNPDLVATVNSASYTETDINEFSLGSRFNPPESLPVSETFLQGALIDPSYRPETFTHPDYEPEAFFSHMVGFGSDFRKELQRIIDGGRKVVLNTYFNSVESQKLRKFGFVLTGPDSDLVVEYAKKTNGYRLAQKLGIPVPFGTIVNSLEEAIKQHDRVSGDHDSVFISSELGSGGRSALHVSDVESIRSFEAIPPYLMTRWLDKVASPNSLVLVGNNRLIYVGLTDQIIKRDVVYYGNSFPSQTSEEVQEKIKKYSIMLAKEMWSNGYRGFVGYDWMVDKEDAVYFSEINPRKNRSSSMLISYLESHRDQDTPSLTELEIKTAIGEDIQETPVWNYPNLRWAMQLYKTHGRGIITRDIKPQYDDISIFRPDGGPNKVSVLNFPRAGTRLAPFLKMHELARVIVVSDDEQSVEREIDSARAQIRESYEKLE